MNSSKWIAAGVVILLIGTLGCSNNSPMAPNNISSSQATQQQPGNNQQLLMVGFAFPNPLIGVVGTRPEGCRSVAIDNTHSVILDVDAANVPFQLIDGMTIVARGHYLSGTDGSCTGIIFEAISVGLPGAGQNTVPTKINIQ